MTIHALVPQCALSVLSYSEYKIAKIFWDFTPGPHWGGLQHPLPPDSPAAQQYPPKLLDITLSLLHK